MSGPSWGRPSLPVGWGAGPTGTPLRLLSALPSATRQLLLRPSCCRPSLRPSLTLGLTSKTTAAHVRTFLRTRSRIGCACRQLGYLSVRQHLHCIAQGRSAAEHHSRFFDRCRCEILVARCTHARKAQLQRAETPQSHNLARTESVRHHIFQGHQHRHRIGTCQGTLALQSFANLANTHFTTRLGLRIKLHRPFLLARFLAGHHRISNCSFHNNLLLKKVEQIYRLPPSYLIAI